MNNLESLRAKVRRPEKSVAICLAGDLQAEFEQLERDLARAREQIPSGTLAAGGSNAEAREIAARIKALQGEMLESTEKFVFRGLPRREYSNLILGNPPTEEQKEKNPEVDVNWDTFGVALLAAACVSHELSEDEWGQLVDDLTTAQYNALFVAARAVNELGLDIPNSLAASVVLASSKKSSK